MPVEWTSSGPELLIHLDREAREPLRTQLERELREAIRAGRLAAAERVPSSRRLATELRISRGLVTEAYAQLQAEGYLTTRAGSATRVADCARPPTVPADPPAPAPPLTVDFRPGVPDLTSFPRHDWAWALRQATRRIPTEALGYGDPQGSPELRTVLAGYLSRVRRTSAGPGQLVICAGFQQGVNLLVRALVRSGVDLVAIEDPGDRVHRVLVERAGARVVPVPVDDDGIDTAALARTGARAVILTPAHQSPTGGVLAPQRRRDLVAWSNQRDATIIEDDYDAEFRYDRDPVGALQGLAPDRVALLGTVSKSLAPALRLGWIACPPALIGPVAAEKALDDRGSPAIDQVALAALIECGRFDRHLRAMRTRYAGRRDALVAALAEHAPGLPLCGLAAGLHGVIRLPDGTDEDAVVAEARRRSVGLYGMRPSRHTPGGTPELVLGFGNLTESAIATGIPTIADLLR